MKKQRGCLCKSCNKQFTSLSAFDKHRKGSFSKNERYCLIAEENLIEVGLRKIFLSDNEVFWTNSEKISPDKLQKLKEKRRVF